MSDSQAPAVPPVPPAGSKNKTLLYVLLGLAVVAVLALALVFAAGFFLVRTVSKAAANPALTAAKVLVAANPSLEIVSSDESAGTVTIRNKENGEELTVDLSAIKQGKLDFRTKDHEASLSVEGEGENARVKISSDQGTAELGGTPATMPDWLPVYPGASAAGVFSANLGEGSQAGWRFATADDAGKVLAFYEEQLKAAGFDVSTNSMSSGGQVAGGMIVAKSGDDRNVHVTVSRDDEGTQVIVAAGEKQ
ncbi:MAG: hypothetical protein KBD01_00830 [Acidobacteria bacterium]|nr:hypothetical protein [Acidobacteriota bacterium]